MARLSQIASGLDMYRKVPVDLMEGTKRGSILSYLALFTMVTLFLLETSAFFSSRWVFLNAIVNTRNVLSLRLSDNTMSSEIKRSLTKAWITFSFSMPSNSIVKDIFLDDNEDSRIRLNFNITMLDLKCEWAVRPPTANATVRVPTRPTNMAADRTSFPAELKQGLY